MKPPSRYVKFLQALMTSFFFQQGFKHNQDSSKTEYY